jgi:hypothetical protein
MHVHHLPEDFTELRLAVFGDMHVGDVMFDESLFERTRDWVLAESNRYCLLSGDIMDMALKGSKGNVYHQKLNPREQLKWCKAAFSPLKERILGIVQGNHEERSAREADDYPLEELAEHLGLSDCFEPESMYLKVTFGKANNGKRSAYGIYMQHQSGGGGTRGGKVNAMARLAESMPYADLYVSAHTHWKAAFKEYIPVPDMNNETFRLAEQLFVNSSTMLRWGGYGRFRGYKPSATGSPHIILYPTVPKHMEAIV